jgi:hypothetical protein
MLSHDSQRDHRNSTSRKGKADRRRKQLGLLRRMARNRSGQAEEVIKLISFILSDTLSLISRLVSFIDGGRCC